MIPVLILGYGNPLRSDDGIGWYAAEALEQVWPSNHVRVERSHQLLPEMADWIGNAGYVIFIDACQESVSGRIHTRPVHPAEPQTTSMTHYFSPQGLLSAARRLYEHAPEARIVSVSAVSFEHGETLTNEIRDILPKVITEVKNMVQEILTQAVPGKAETHA